MSLSRRRWLKRVGASSLSFAAAACARRAPVVFAAAVEPKPLRVCLLSGSKEYKSNESLAAFQEDLERDYPIKCSRAFWTASDNLPGLEALDQCDVMVLFTKRLTIDGEQLERVKKYCLAGRPIVGLRTASHAFQHWLELDRLVLGGDYSGHYDGGIITKVSIVDGHVGHPVLQGVSPFESVSKLYKNPHVAEDVTLLLNGTIPGHVEPLAWVRTFKDARVFYTSLGGPEDFGLEPFRQLVTNALFWTTGREAPQPASS